MQIVTLYEKIEKLLTKEIQKYYRKRLVSLVFYGSVARGTPHPFSDIDFLIVAKPFPKGRIPRVREFEKIERKLEPSLTHEWDGLRGPIPLSPIFKTPEEVRMGSLLFLDFVTDAKIAYDRNHFFKNFLVDLKERLKELGSKKVMKGGAWYWVLKPDLRPGETIELSV